MQLHDVWFVVIAVLWTGYFFLEGFDFGVGVLTSCSPATAPRRRVLINTIGPVWDGNEVWLLTRGRRHLRRLPRLVRHPLLRLLPAAAAHPGLPDRARRRLRVPGQAPRGAAGSATGSTPSSGPRCCPRSCGAWPSPTSCAGVPIDARQGVRRHARGPAQPVRPARRAGHAHPLHLPRRGVHRAQDRRRHPRTGPAGWPPGSAWPPRRSRSVFLLLDPGRHAATARAWSRCRGAWSRCSVARRRQRGAGARAGRSRSPGVTVAAAVAMLFLALFPDVMPSSLNADWSLTVTQRRLQPVHAEDHDLVRGVATPLVLLYQGWTYWVFRKRIGTQHIAATPLTSPEERFHVKPVDPRLLRYARATRRLPGRLRGCSGLVGAALVIAQAMLIADSSSAPSSTGVGRRTPHARCCCWRPSRVAGRWSPGSPNWPRTGRARRSSPSCAGGCWSTPAALGPGLAERAAHRSADRPRHPRHRRPRRLLLALPAAARPGRRRARGRAGADRHRRLDLGGDHRRHAAAHPAVHGAHRLGHAGPDGPSVAAAVPALRALPRRGRRAADAEGLRPGQGAGRDDPRGSPPTTAGRPCARCGSPSSRPSPWNCSPRSRSRSSR